MKVCRFRLPPNLAETVGLGLLEVFRLGCRYPKPETLNSIVCRCLQGSGVGFRYQTTHQAQSGSGDMDGFRASPLVWVLRPKWRDLVKFSVLRCPEHGDSTGIPSVLPISPSVDARLLANFKVPFLSRARASSESLASNSASSRRPCASPGPRK